MLAFRDPIDIQTIINRVEEDHYECRSHVWQAFDDFFHNARYLYGKNERLRSNLSQLEARVVRMRRQGD